jgi:hypothetical protein
MWEKITVTRTEVTGGALFSGFTASDTVDNSAVSAVPPAPTLAKRKPRTEGRFCHLDRTDWPAIFAGEPIA